MEGIWTFFETLSDAGQSVRCDDQGRFDLTRTTIRVSGEGAQQGRCTEPNGSVDNSGIDSLRDVRTSDTTIAFSFGGCSYQARLIASPPDSMSGTVRCPPGNQRAVTLTGTWFAALGLDELPPAVSGAQVPPAGDTLFVPKDTFRITVTAEDDRKLLWVGYRLGPPAAVQDSVRVVAKSGQASFELAVPIPAAWVGNTPLTLFARDAFDRVTEQPSGALRVYDLIRRPLRTVPLGTLAFDVEYDAKRNLVYLLEPADSQIAVLKLEDLTLGTPIPVPTNLPETQGSGMDLSPSGDSLIVAITTPPVLHIISLVDGSTSEVPITDTGSDSQVLFDVTVAAGRAFAYGERTESGSGFITGRLWQLDLATKVQQVRTDAGAQGTGSLGLQTEFAASGDGSHLLLVDTPVPCMQVFSAAAGFGACAEPPHALTFLPSGSFNGSAWLVRHNLYDASLAVAATPVPEGTPAGVLAPDASVAYFPTPLGLDVIELPSGTVRDHVRIPVAIGRLTLLPEAGRIAIWTDGGFAGDGLRLDRITIVDLE